VYGGMGLARLNLTGGNKISDSRSDGWRILCDG
jgi:hypothetical protein